MKHLNRHSNSASHTKHSHAQCTPRDSRKTFGSRQQWNTAGLGYERGALLVSAAYSKNRVELMCGQVVEFQNKYQRMTGIAEGANEKGYCKVMDQFGDKYLVDVRNLLYIYPGSGLSKIRLGMLKDDPPVIDEELMEVIWQQLREQDRGPVFLEEISRVYWGHADTEECFLLFQWLHSDYQAYFQPIGKYDPSYMPRTEEAVEKLKAQFTERKRKLTLVKAWKATVKKAQKEQPPPEYWKDTVWLKYITKLEAYARTGMDLYDDAKDILMQLNKPSTKPDSALQLLKSIGYLSQHTNLVMLQAGLTSEFPPLVKQMADSILGNTSRDNDEGFRQDLRHLESYLIDQEGAQELDDAVGLERLPEGGIRYWVHVADPTRYVEPKDPLDVEALRRGKSLYLAEGTVSMFPPNIAAIFSLSAERDCSAFSFGAEIDEQGDIIDESIQFIPTIIRPTAKCTYDQVSEWLAGGEGCPADLLQLQEMAQLRQQFRLEQGGVDFYWPKSQPRVRNEEAREPEVTLVPDVRSESRELVQELAIFANELAGKIGKMADLVMPYRGTRETLDLDLETRQYLSDSVEDMAYYRKRLPHVYSTSSFYQPHSILGASAYTQCTSPIRRYSDMLTHYQLKALLKGQQRPYSEADLDDSLSILQSSVQSSNTVEKESSQYWLCHFYMQRMKQFHFRATVLEWYDNAAGKAHVLVDDIFTDTSAILQNSTNTNLGDKVILKVTKADPTSSYLQFQEIYSGNERPLPIYQDQPQSQQPLQPQQPPQQQAEPAATASTDSTQAPPEQAPDPAAGSQPSLEISSHPPQDMKDADLEEAELDQIDPDLIRQGASEFQVMTEPVVTLKDVPTAIRKPALKLGEAKKQLHRMLPKEEPVDKARKVEQLEDLVDQEGEAIVLKAPVAKATPARKAKVALHKPRRLKLRGAEDVSDWRSHSQIVDTAQGRQRIPPLGVNLVGGDEEGSGGNGSGGKLQPEELVAAAVGGRRNRTLPPQQEAGKESVIISGQDEVSEGNDVGSRQDDTKPVQKQASAI